MTDTCDIALKEWACVIRAMESGAQTVLLRKGGLDEDQGRFRLDASRFLLFPTFEHQHPRLLKPEWAHLAARPGSEVQGFVRLSSFATLQQSRVVTDPAELVPLRDHFIWNDDYVRGRLEFKPEWPLYLILIRVYRLQTAASAPVRAHYGGCRSWITLETAVGLPATVPVLTDNQFNRARRELGFEERGQG